MIIERKDTGLKSKPGKIYILPPWATTEFLVSKVIGLNINDEGEDNASGDPEQKFKFSAGAPVMMHDSTGKSTMAVSKRTMDFPALGVAVFDDEPGEPQPYAVQIPVWHGERTATKGALYHYFTGTEEDTSGDWGAIASAVAQGTGALIGGLYTGNLEGAKAGYDVGKAVGGVLDGVIPENANEFFGIHANYFMDCDAGSSYTDPQSGKFICMNPFGTSGKPSYDNRFNTVDVGDVEVSNIGIATQNLFEQAPLVNHVRVVLKSVPSPKRQISAAARICMCTLARPTARAPTAASTS